MPCLRPLAQKIPAISGHINIGQRRGKMTEYTALLPLQEAHESTVQAEPGDNHDHSQGQHHGCDLGQHDLGKEALHHAILHRAGGRVQVAAENFIFSPQFVRIAGAVSRLRADRGRCSGRPHPIN